MTDDRTITIDADKGREIALTVAEAIRKACDALVKKEDRDDYIDMIEGVCTIAVDAAMQALADAIVPAIYKLPEPTYRGVPWSPAREAEARAHYEGWDDQPGYVPWVSNGNSLKQEEARDIVRKRILGNPDPSAPPALGRV